MFHWSILACFLTARNHLQQISITGWTTEPVDVYIWFVCACYGQVYFITEQRNVYKRFLSVSLIWYFFNENGHKTASKTKNCPPEDWLFNGCSFDFWFSPAELLVLPTGNQQRCSHYSHKPVSLRGKITANKYSSLYISCLQSILSIDFPTRCGRQWCQLRGLLDEGNAIEVISPECRLLYSTHWETKDVVNSIAFLSFKKLEQLDAWKLEKSCYFLGTRLNLIFLRSASSSRTASATGNILSYS